MPPRKRATGRITRRSRARRRPASSSRGRECINFGSNNYLSLSYHPAVIEATIAATRKFGSGVTGSRLLNGTLTLHKELEGELADFYGREAALVFATGYVANMSAIAGYLGRNDVAIIDKEIHNSLLTGVKLSGASMKRFRHNDLAHLEKILAALRRGAGKGVIVDGVYSMGGDTAPLDRMVELCHRFPNTFVLDDEAHGIGVLGERGLGAAEQYGVLNDVDIITITFSKTLGSCGGALDRLGRSHRADDARLRHAHLHGVQHARFGRRRARRAAHPARRARAACPPAKQRRRLPDDAQRAGRADQPGGERDRDDPACGDPTR